LLSQRDQLHRARGLVMDGVIGCLGLDATADDRFARIGLTPDVIALIRRRLAAWPRDPSQVPGASASRPQPDTVLRSDRYTSRPRRYPSGGGS